MNPFAHLHFTAAAPQAPVTNVTAIAREMVASTSKGLVVQYQLIGGGDQKKKEATLASKVPDKNDFRFWGVARDAVVYGKTSGTPYASVGTRGLFPISLPADKDRAFKLGRTHSIGQSADHSEFYTLQATPRTSELKGDRVGVVLSHAKGQHPTVLLSPIRHASQSIFERILTHHGDNTQNPFEEQATKAGFAPVQPGTDLAKLNKTSWSDGAALSVNNTNPPGRGGTSLASMKSAPLAAGFTKAPPVATGGGTAPVVSVASGTAPPDPVSEQGAPPPSDPPEAASLASLMASSRRKKKRKSAVGVSGDLPNDGGGRSALRGSKKPKDASDGK